MKKLFAIITFSIVIFSDCAAQSDRFELRIGDNTFFVEIVSTPEGRSQGLMNRSSLGEDAGMLFVFPTEQRLSFWMRNTQIPLSIAYITRSGEIREIYDMQPFSEVSVTSRGSAYMFALEVNQGMFRSLGIEVGDFIIIPQELLDSLEIY